jgi:hypothetical protein
MIAAAAIAVFAALAQDAGLLQNGGFEELGGDRPARWDVFVAPFPVQSKGAPSAADEVPTARVSRETHDGSYCVVLHTPTAYPIEPYNNWSQNILGRHSGKRLRLSGWLKTEHAEGAALWAQCWKREPLHVAHVANTAEEMPVYGSTDWQEVSVEFDVPEGIDFLTVRCVLRGAGKAWFDDVKLEEVKEEEQEAASAETEADAMTEEGPEEGEEEEAPEAAATMKESTPSRQAAAEGKRERAPVQEASPAPVPVAAPDTAAIEAELARLRAANASLQDALTSMRSDNQALVESLSTLQAQIRSLQDMLHGKEPEVKPGEPIPPLVPMEFETPGQR